MYHLATVFPLIRRWRLPLSRDQFMLLMVATNQIFLGIDTYLAHAISGTIRPNEWIPVIFGPVAGALLLLAGAVALRYRPAATVIATLTLLASAVVGFLGAYFHLIRGILPTAPAGQQVTLNLLIWAPPILGPMMFAIVGILGISAAWLEEPVDSGNLRLLGGYHLQLPYSKTQAYFYIVGMAGLAALISSVLDHARLNFESPWLWLPIVIGVFGTVVAVTLGAIDHPTRNDLVIYVAAMVLLILLGVIGAALHADSNIVREAVLVGERFIRGAPLLAPLLFANVGMIGLLVLLDPAEYSRP